MKNISGKKSLFIVLFLFTVYYIYSQGNDKEIVPYTGNSLSFMDYDGEEYNFKLFGIRPLAEAGLRFWFPIDSSLDFFAFINFGLGLGIDLIKHFLSPGLYIDIGIGLDWFYLFSDGKKNDDYTPTQFFLSGGVRLYNVINILNFNIVPHIGYNLLLFFMPFLNIGVSVSFWKLPIAIEYAYYPQRYSTYHNIHNSFHQIMLKILFNSIKN